MENDPAKDVIGVIRLLTQGTRENQKAAIDTYFSPDAGFLHPFVRVPRFSVVLPILGVVNSRSIIAAIYRWYRFLSPEIDFTIHSSLYDKKRRTVYVDMSQCFSIWFIPFYQAQVRLVTVLTLRPCYRDAQGEIVDLPENSGFEVRDQARNLLRIAHQDDLYQVNEFLKFILPGFGALLWSLYQIFVALECLVGSAAVSPFAV